MRILTPEYVAVIRAEVAAALPEGMRLLDHWRAVTSTDWDGKELEELEVLHLGVSGAGDTIAGIEALVEVDMAANDKHPEFFLDLHPGWWLDD